MTTNNNYHGQLGPNDSENISHSLLLLPEDNRLWEIVSPTQLFTEWQLPPLQTVVIDDNNNKRQTKKCRGNRKVQHFKRRCRMHGLTEEQIQRLLHERDSHVVSEQSFNDRTATMIGKQQQQQQQHTTESSKRKRGNKTSDDQSNSVEFVNNSIKSLSQLSIFHEEQGAQAARREKEKEEEGLKKMKNSMREKMQSSSLSSSFPDNNND